MWRSLVTIVRLIKQQNGNVTWWRKSARKGLNSTSGAQFAALLLLKPAFWFVRAIVNWRSRFFAKLAYRDVIVLSLNATLAYYKKPNIRFNKQGKLCWQNDFGRFSKDNTTTVTTTRTGAKNLLTQNFISQFQNLRFLNEDKYKTILAENEFYQEPITQSEQLPCAPATAFSRTTAFLERVWRVSKTCRPNKWYFCLLITFSFPFWYHILRMRS